MRRIILYIIFLVASKGILYSQQNEMLNYYSQVNSAELLLCKSKFKKANRIYSNLVKTNTNSLFEIDKYNYYILLCLLKDKRKASDLGKQLIAKKFRVFDVENIYVKTFNDSLKSDYIFNDTISRLSNLMFWDQQVRKYCPSYQGKCIETVEYV